MGRVGLRVGLVPVLGGFALALAIVALVVNEVQAETVCERCKRLAGNRANSDPNICGNVGGQMRLACINNYVHAQCVANGPCPDANPAPSTVTCAGYLPEGTTCDNGGTGICNNETWNVNCEPNTRAC